MVIINTLSPEKINLTFEFFNSYFYKFDFKIPNYGSNIDITYYVKIIKLLIKTKNYIYNNYYFKKGCFATC